MSLYLCCLKQLGVLSRLGGPDIKLAISSVSIGAPVRFDAAGARLQPGVGGSGDDQLLLPKHCREAHITYGAPLKVSFVRSDRRDGAALKKEVVVGMAPLMVRSKLCSTRGMSPAELQRAGEDVDDGGGYFIINGNERVIRFVVQQRTNFPIALKRPAFANRDAFCTPYAVLLRSQRYDGTSTSNILLDTEDGRCTYRILLNRQEYFCGFFLLLRCLAGNLSLAQLKAKLLEGCWDDAADATARSQLVEELWGQEATFADSDVLENRPLHQLGLLFWKAVHWLLRPGSSYEAAGTYVIRHFVLPHLSSWSEKFDMALLMYKKLRLLKQGKISAESLDSFAYQEVVLPGQILASVLKDALFSCLAKIRLHYLQEIRMLKNSGNDPTAAIYSNKFFDLATDSQRDKVRVLGEDVPARLSFLADAARKLRRNSPTSWPQGIFERRSSTFNRFVVVSLEDCVAGGLAADAQSHHTTRRRHLTLSTYVYRNMCTICMHIYIYIYIYIYSI
ncbi:DNA-directed RNA polymerase I RPA2 [Toxoplasma gondii RUB]|uniref:DNA-directed RNA polymerase n=1 Tax=Toxoplasma gondii RUB TaxID=935652 RepID=A0A086LXD4_TOXGO|nr:DNA-directed RNA polymerase I RPA2 [Toxoplasma gondii RUB]